MGSTCPVINYCFLFRNGIFFFESKLPQISIYAAKENRSHHTQQQNPHTTPRNSRKQQTQNITKTDNYSSRLHHKNLIAKAPSSENTA
jgi:hypothetical protein